MRLSQLACLRRVKHCRLHRHRHLYWPWDCTIRDCSFTTNAFMLISLDRTKIGNHYTDKVSYMYSGIKTKDEYHLPSRESTETIGIEFAFRIHQLKQSVIKRPAGQGRGDYEFTSSSCWNCPPRFCCCRRRHCFCCGSCCDSFSLFLRC